MPSETPAATPTSTAKTTPKETRTPTPAPTETPTPSPTPTPTATPAPTPTASSTPGPDTDGDTIPDSTDPDDDNDGVYDTAESACGGSALDAARRPERIDTSGDDDGDGLFNEPLPPASEVHDCDGDGWTGGQEMAIYMLESTSQDQDPCGSGWPADLSGDDNRLNIADLSSFIFPSRGDGSFNKMGHPVPDPDDPIIARWNLDPNGVINIADLNALNPAVDAPTSRPPMLGGVPAFFTNLGQCPFPP